MDEHEKELISSQKYYWFVKHIESHLKEDKYKDVEPKGKVICKICGKTVEQIAEDKLNEIKRIMKEGA